MSIVDLPYGYREILLCRNNAALVVEGLTTYGNMGIARNGTGTVVQLSRIHCQISGANHLTLLIAQICRVDLSRPAGQITRLVVQLRVCRYAESGITHDTARISGVGIVNGRCRYGQIIGANQTLLVLYEIRLYGSGLCRKHLTAGIVQ